MSLSRRSLLGLAAGTLVLRMPGAFAQRTTEPARLGWLSYVRPPDPALDDLRRGLREIGLVEGKSFVLVERYADDDFTRLPKLVEELAGERLKLLVSRGPSTNYAMAIRERVPIVFIYSGDPVAAGFAGSLAKPGRNMTGLTFMALELSAKRVAVLKELVPGATRIALLSNPEHAGELAEYRVTEEAAQKLGAAITRYLVRTAQDLRAAMAKIAASGHDAMLVFPDSLTLVHRKEIADQAARAKIPTMYGWTEYVRAGGLISYGPTLGDGFPVLAKFIDQILKGASAGSIPIEQASRISLTLNAGAARTLGITVPPALLAQAEQVESSAAGSSAAPK
jgi:putative tryptophan/tyrosine transport system substrate-binding protein